jgi:tetraacyldisaccharide 4'-kinase
LPFSFLYGVVMTVRNWAYDRGWKRSYAVGVPVISVGNITVGGTGKTPMAEFLLASLCAMGYSPAYLSRGYGRQTKGYLHVNPAEGGAERYGDEPFQVATRFPQVPVAVCEDRVAGAQRLIAEHRVNVLVLDDAFQHRRIRRDLDLVMIDTTRMPTRDRPFPAGRMRERLRGLRRARVLVLSKWANAGVLAAAQQDISTRFPEQLLAAFEMQPTGLTPFFPAGGPMRAADMPALTSLEDLRGLEAMAFSGIGNNAHFRNTLDALGVQVSEHLHFPDHHRYSEVDLDKILVAFEAQKEIKGKLRPALILTTEKDFFRLKAMPWIGRFAHLPMAYLTVGMVPRLGWDELSLEIKKIIK